MTQNGSATSGPAIGNASQLDGSATASHELSTGGASSRPTLIQRLPDGKLVWELGWLLSGLGFACVTLLDWQVPLWRACCHLPQNRLHPLDVSLVMAGFALCLLAGTLGTLWGWRGSRAAYLVGMAAMAIYHGGDTALGAYMDVQFVIEIGNRVGQVLFAAVALLGVCMKCLYVVAAVVGVRSLYICFPSRLPLALARLLRITPVSAR